MDPNLIASVIPYDAKRRQLKTESCHEGMPLPEQALIDFLSKSLGTLPASIEREVSDRARFRILFTLLPADLLFEEPPIEQKPLIAEHLIAMGIEPSASLVSAVKCVCEHFQRKRSASRKFGINDVYVRFPQVYRQLMQRQNERCCYCGAQLIYGDNATLDHIWPFHLGDDPNDGANWCFACALCNRGKGEFPTYSLTGAGVNWISPNERNELTAKARFATFARDRRCVVCSTGPDTTVFCVVKKIDSGCWVLDNLKTVCTDCT
jgi:5-methylcytosine-specific restriction endonuclease McrA